MSDTHSIWLMPSEPHLSAIEDVVQRLSREYGSPQFLPHLTLVEDMPRSCMELNALLSEHFAGKRVVRSVIQGISGTPMFFRSLYAAFAPEGNLLSIKEKAISVFEKGDIISFMPHISLAYGFTELQRVNVLDTLNRDLGGREIVFDSIAVVGSAQAIPIEDWKIVFQQPLQSDSTSRLSAWC